MLLKPSSLNGKKELEVYQGERKTRAIVKALTAAMPDYVARITAPSFDGWQSKAGAKVVLFSKKREAPAQLKALSTKCANTAHTVLPLLNITSILQSLR